MRISAISSAGDAIDATRQFLYGQSLLRYLTLGMMALFLGPAGVSGPPGPIQFREEAFETNDTQLPTPEELFDAIPMEAMLLVIALIGLFALGYALLGSFMEFAFVHSLATEVVQLREPMATYWRHALGLFAFRVVLWSLTFGPMLLVGLTALGVLEIPLGISLLGLGAIASAMAVFGYVINRLTTDFVVPVMLHEDRNVLDGWRRMLGVMRRELREYIAYIPIRIMIEVALGIAIGIIMGIGFVAIGIFLGIPLGLVFYLALGFVGVAIVAVLLLLVGLVALVLVLVPFHTYLRYYTLLVLGDTEDELDLIPGLRETVRNGPTV